MPYGWMDDLHIDATIVGLDTSLIIFVNKAVKDSIMRKVTDFFNDKIIFESDLFWRSGTNTFIEGKKVVFSLDYWFDHKLYKHMSEDEFLSYLNMLNARIHIVSLLKKPYLVELSIDKELMFKKLKGRVKSLKKDR